MADTPDTPEWQQPSFWVTTLTALLSIGVAFFSLTEAQTSALSAVIPAVALLVSGVVSNKYLHGQHDLRQARLMHRQAMEMMHAKSGGKVNMPVSPEGTDPREL